MASGKPVSAIMSTEPVVANESTKFSQVLRLFSEFPVHHLPIVNIDNQLIGIVSSNDLYKVFQNLCNKKDKLTMSLDVIDGAVQMKDLMTHNPVTITSADTIVNAARIFAEKRFLSLPVVDDGRLIGILSAKDVIGYFADIS